MHVLMQHLIVVKGIWLSYELTIFVVPLLLLKALTYKNATSSNGMVTALYSKDASRYDVDFID